MGPTSQWRRSTLPSFHWWTWVQLVDCEALSTVRERETSLCESTNCERTPHISYPRYFSNLWKDTHACKFFLEVFYLQALASTVTSNSFEIFLDGLKKSWNEKASIPQNIKSKGPLLLLDNFPAHRVISTKQFHFQFLPPYSPFLNVAEPVNRDHKAGIRKLFRFFKTLPQYLEQISWGRKGKESVQFALQCAHMAWNDLPDTYAQKHWENIKKIYFPMCLTMSEIKGWFFELFPKMDIKW